VEDSYILYLELYHRVYCNIPSCQVIKLAQLKDLKDQVYKYVNYVVIMGIPQHIRANWKMLPKKDS
jgi:hypothetical protein